MAAANMDTLIVLPKRRGVLMSTSCARCSHEFSCSTCWWQRAKLPGGSIFQKVRVHALRKSSWNCRWWKLRFQPVVSSRASALRHSRMRIMGVLLVLCCAVLPCDARMRADSALSTRRRLLVLAGACSRAARACTSALLVSTSRVCTAAADIVGVMHRRK